MLAENRKIGYIVKHEVSKPLQSRYSPRQRDFFASIDFRFPVVFIYGREGEEYNTRKGNNSSLTLEAFEPLGRPFGQISKLSKGNHHERSNLSVFPQCKL